MKQRGNELLYQVNFPASQADKKSSVYYTVYNNDESVFLARTNNGVLEFGDGSYGVNLTFNNEDSYSIYWEIDGTPYKASEDINIFDFRELVQYSGYGL